MTLVYQQFSNLLIPQRDMTGPRLGRLSNNRWSEVPNADSDRSFLYLTKMMVDFLSLITSITNVLNITSFGSSSIRQKCWSLSSLRGFFFFFFLVVTRSFIIHFLKGKPCSLLPDVEPAPSLSCVDNPYESACSSETLKRCRCSHTSQQCNSQAAQFTSSRSTSVGARMIAPRAQARTYAWSRPLQYELNHWRQALDDFSPLGDACPTLCHDRRAKRRKVKVIVGEIN